jgi:uncharacterized iron-regulated membrane protein
MTPDASWPDLVRRLHFYAGILVGPFLLVAAVSGALYALTPQLEQVVYRQQLQVDPAANPLPLSRQIDAALAAAPAGELSAVRPAPAPGETTRVLFSSDSLGESETRAVFVDPGTGLVRGTMTTYGTSGALPLRTWIDQLHRSLHLGDTGRLYSELAASWLWVVVLGGVVLWATHVRRLLPRRGASGPSRIRSWHATVGVWCALGFLGLSATGLTWSQHAGTHVADLRAAVGWETPSLSATVGPGEAHHGAGSTGGAGASPVLFDQVLAVARSHGIDAGKVEIRKPAAPGKAWVVAEIDRSWPTQVDAVAVDAHTLTVVDQLRFADYPLAAKLSRWGIDAHMGVLFGLPNQLALAALATGLSCMVVWGYRMWWQRRPTAAGRVAVGAPPAAGALRRIPRTALLPLAAVVVLVGWFLPLLGITLAAFLVIDLLLGVRRRGAASAAAN